MRHHRLHLAVEMMNSLRPDFVVLTGDYVCLSPRPLPELTAALKKLNMPAYATLGNHESQGTNADPSEGTRPSPGR